MSIQRSRCWIYVLLLISLLLWEVSIIYVWILEFIFPCSNVCYNYVALNVNFHPLLLYTVATALELWNYQLPRISLRLLLQSDDEPLGAKIRLLSTYQGVIIYIYISVYPVLEMQLWEYIQRMVSLWVTWTQLLEFRITLWKRPQGYIML